MVARRAGWRQIWISGLVSALLRASALAAPPPEAGDGLAAEALPCLRFLLEEGRYGAADQEVAAWLVRRDGDQGTTLECVLWPRPRHSGRAEWPGSRPVPAGTVAQAHTHATRAASGRAFGALPSRQDCRIARQLGIPVWTVSPQGLGECDPQAGRGVQRWGSSWVSRLTGAGWTRDGEVVRWPASEPSGPAPFIAEASPDTDAAVSGEAPQAEPNAALPRRPRTRLR